jgi:hypothetical protein
MLLPVLRFSTHQLITLCPYKLFADLRVQIGFLYLRYVCPPRELWEWMGPFCGDNEVRHSCIKRLSCSSSSSSSMTCRTVAVRRGCCNKTASWHVQNT